MASKDGFMGKLFKMAESIAEGDAEADLSREQAIVTNTKLWQGKTMVDDLYKALRISTLNLRENYKQSKTSYNLFLRYLQMKRAIKELLSVDETIMSHTKAALPEQKEGEPTLDYTFRLLTAMERGGHRLADARAQNEERYKDMDTREINKENYQLQIELHKLIKKYFVLRSIVMELDEDYEDSKDYPIIPRYSMIKNMIKEVMRNPEFISIVQEETMSGPT